MVAKNILVCILVHVIMKQLKTKYVFCAAALLGLLVLGCFDSDDILEPNETTGQFRGAVGGLWEGCEKDPDSPQDLLDDWGCDGEPGIGLKCVTMPTEYGRKLSICAPQIADPQINATCSQLPSPPTSGDTLPSANGLCLPSCDPGLCEPGYVCSTKGYCGLPW